MTVEATLKATGVQLVLSVQGYKFPQFDTGWDANWLVCDVQLDVHGRGTVSRRLPRPGARDRRA